MPTVFGPGTVNPYSGSVPGASIPGDAATGHAKRLISSFVDELEPYDTPMLTALRSSAKKVTVNQIKIEGHIKRARPLQTTLAGGAYSTSQTSLNLGTTNIKYFQKGMVVKIDNEIFWTTADPDLAAGTIPVAFEQAGTTNAGHAQHAVVDIIGTASPLNGPEYYISPVIYGDFNFNYIQRFLASIRVDELTRKTPDLQHETDKLLDMIATEAKNQKILLNKAIIAGRRQEGSLAVGSARPPLMGGIGSYLTTNVRTITGGSPLSVFDIEEVSSNVWSTYRQMSRTMFMSMRTKRSFNRLMNPHREGTFQDTTMNLVVEKVRLETGEFSTVVDPYMPDGEIWGLDLSGFEWYTYNGMDWRTDDVEDNGTLSDQKGIVGVFSMLPVKEPLMWRITGFSTNLNDYPMSNL
jgi:hypothetical protein